MTVVNSKIKANELVDLFLIVRSNKVLKEIYQRRCEKQRVIKRMRKKNEE